MLYKHGAYKRQSTYITYKKNIKKTIANATLENMTD
jgi:hypothetical protein